MPPSLQHYKISVNFAVVGVWMHTVFNGGSVVKWLAHWTSNLKVSSLGSGPYHGIVSFAPCCFCLPRYRYGDKMLEVTLHYLQLLYAIET